MYWSVGNQKLCRFWMVLIASCEVLAVNGLCDGIWSDVRIWLVPISGETPRASPEMKSRTRTSACIDQTSDQYRQNYPEPQILGEVAGSTADRKFKCSSLKEMPIITCLNHSQLMISNNQLLCFWQETRSWSVSGNLKSGLNRFYRLVRRPGQEPVPEDRTSCNLGWTLNLEGLCQSNGSFNEVISKWWSMTNQPELLCCKENKTFYWRCELRLRTEAPPL